jgi:hypothetical protein
MSYKNILAGYVNKRDDGSEYLVITNQDTEDVVIKVGEKLFLNKTPQARLEQYPKIPHFSKSVKLDEEKTESEKVADDFISSLTPVKEDEQKPTPF